MIEISNTHWVNAKTDYKYPLTSAILTALSHIEKSGLDISKLMGAVVDITVRELQADDGSLIVINEGFHIEHTCYYQEKPHRRKPDAFLQTILRDGTAGWVVRKRQPHLINNTLADARWLQRPHSQVALSVVCVPLLSHGRAVAALTIHRPTTHPFTEEHLHMLTEAMTEAANHIENARLFAASQRQLQIAALLNEASRAINSSLHLDDIMASLLSQMNEFLNAEALSIALVDEASKELVYQVAEGLGSHEIKGLRLPSNHGLSGWVMEHCQPALVTNTREDPRFNLLGDQRTGYQTRSMICAPMQFKGDVLGTIQAINPVEGTFTQQDLDLLISLANIASSAIANATQFARTQAAEAQYTSLFQDTINPIILTDLAGYITQVNKRTTQFLRYSADELLGRHISTLHESGAELLPAESVQSDSVKVFTSQILTSDKQKVSVEVYAKRTLFEQSEILQWILYDISKHVELEQVRHDLTAMLFHDLQSPLGNVISSLELLSYELPPVETNSSLYYMLDIAKRSAERTQALVHSLLDINRLEAGHPITERTIVDIYDLVADIWEIERPNFEQRRVQFVEALAPALPDIYIEEDIIRRVLINLVENALKYSSEGQRITVSAALMEDQKGVVMAVIDQGVGVPAEYRQSIFKKFERIKQANSDSKGLGLGLAFCRLAVEAHNGRIWVEDAPGGGAQFMFTLPFVRPPANY